MLNTFIMLSHSKQMNSCFGNLARCVMGGALLGGLLIGPTDSLLAAGCVPPAGETGCLEFDLPQSIYIDSAVTEAGLETSIQFTVRSNSGFDISFAGDSPDENGVLLGYPRFTKQRVNASGELIPNRYDYLQTEFGILVERFQSVQRGYRWGNDVDPKGPGEHLVKPLNVIVPEPHSPHAAIGRIMTDAIIQESDVTLYLKIVPAPNAQSGRYSMTLTFIATADPE